MKRYMLILIGIVFVFLIAPIHAYAGQSCEVQLYGWSKSPPYKQIMELHVGKFHLTCPFDWKSTQIATMYIVEAKGSCATQSLGRFKINLARNLDRISDQYRICSDILSGFDRKKLSSQNVDSYIWVPKYFPNIFSAQQAHLGVKAHNSIVLSGVPILDDNLSNVGLCFSVGAGSKQTPANILEGIGIVLPWWDNERKFSNLTCADAVVSFARTNGSR